MIYCIDLDQTLCDTEGNDYPSSKPIQESIDAVNRLWGQGHTIKIFTGRGSRSGKDWRELTVNQLQSWGVAYSYLIMGKPDADLFVDDKNMSLAQLKATEPTLIRKLAACHVFGGAIYVCGNGGLAAESSHFAAEMVGKYAFDVFIRCISLASDMSVITALANDLGYENVFSHQVRYIGQPGNIFIGMTTSQSPNIVKACIAARERNMGTVMICGKKSEVEADFVIRMDGKDTAEIQNNIIQYLHVLAYEVKKLIYEDKDVRL